MEIERTFPVQASREIVWSLLTSAEDVGNCLPGCENVERVGPDRFKAVMRVVVGPITARFNLEIESTDSRAPEFVTYATKGEEGGRASFITAKTFIWLIENGEHTDVKYCSTVQVVGRLGKFASGLMLKVAASVSDEFISRFRVRVLNAPGSRSDEQSVASPSGLE